jgi:hypothetical protein
MLGEATTDPAPTGRTWEEHFHKLSSEPVSPELILVSPPDLAERARSALPDRHEALPSRIPERVPQVRVAPDAPVVEYPTYGVRISLDEADMSISARSWRRVSRSHRGSH